MRYVICKKEEEILTPLLDKNNDLIIFKDAEEANLERIYLQPDHVERLVVYPTKLGA